MASTEKLITEIFRSSRKEGAYLYVEKGKDQSELPELLLKQLGRLEQAMVLVLTPDKKLANADASKVIDAIQSQGFYLQMPPVPEPFRQSIPNDKLTHKPV